MDEHGRVWPTYAQAREACARELAQRMKANGGIEVLRACHVVDPPHTWNALLVGTLGIDARLHWNNRLHTFKFPWRCKSAGSTKHEAGASPRSVSPPDPAHPAAA